MSPYWTVALGTFAVHEAAWLAFNIPYLLCEKVCVCARVGLACRAVSSAIILPPPPQFGWCGAYKIDPRATPLNTLQAQMAVFKRLLTGHFTQLLPVLLISAHFLLWVGFTVTPDTLPSMCVCMRSLLHTHVCMLAGVAAGAFRWRHAAFQRMLGDDLLL